MAEKHDCGRMNIECHHCRALHWVDERVSSSIQFPEFSMCCGHGHVVIPLLPNPPPSLHELYIDQSTQAQEFRSNIVLYNRALTFTSMRVNQDFEVNNGSGPPVFKIHGELKHWSGALISQGEHPASYA